MAYGLSTESFLAISLSQYKFLMKEFHIKKVYCESTKFFMAIMDLPQVFIQRDQLKI